MCIRDRLLTERIYLSYGPEDFLSSTLDARSFSIRFAPKGWRPPAEWYIKMGLEVPVILPRKAGRPAGSPNRAGKKIENSSVRNERINIRCSSQVKEWTKKACEKDNISESDLYQVALKYYLRGSAWWLQGEDFKKMDNDI